MTGIIEVTIRAQVLTTDYKEPFDSRLSDFCLTLKVQCSYFDCEDSNRLQREIHREKMHDSTKRLESLKSL